MVATSVLKDLANTMSSMPLLNKAFGIETYEALIPVQHETQYDTGYSDMAFLEKLGHDTMGIQSLIN